MGGDFSYIKLLTSLLKSRPILCCVITEGQNLTLLMH